jgi:ankyrin repeat protein
LYPKLPPNDRANFAVFNNNIDELKIAIQNGADVNYSKDGISLLQWASNNGNLAMVRYLVEHGADINRRGFDNRTALIIAAEVENFDIIRYLVEHGANVNLRASDGSTAASMAYDRGNVDIYDYLMANGAREFEQRQVAQQPAAPSSTTNVYVQPSAPAQSSTPAPTPSAPTFQTGTYAWSNSGQNMTMQFSVGMVFAQFNNRQIWRGTYSINGTQLVISVTSAISDYSRLQGMTYSYTITSNTSFSGSGETWVRTGY